MTIEPIFPHYKMIYINKREGLHHNIKQMDILYDSFIISCCSKNTKAESAFDATSLEVNLEQSLAQMHME